METIIDRTNSDNWDLKRSKWDEISTLFVENYDFTITCKKLKNAWFCDKEVSLFESLYSYIGNLYNNEFRRNEIHEQTNQKAYYAYHFQMVVRIMCDIYASIKKLEHQKINKYEIEYVNFFEKYKIVLLILALFHDSIEDNKFSWENNKQIWFDIVIKYNKDIDLIRDDIVRHLEIMLSKDIFNEEEISKYFPLLGNIRNSKSFLLNDNENLLKFEIWILNFVFFILDVVNKLKLNWWELNHISNDMIRRIVEWLWALTFKIGTGYDSYISELVSHNFLFIIKVPDFLHNSFVWMSRKQRRKYCKDYTDLYNIVYLLRNNIPDYVRNKLDKTMYSLLIEWQYQLDLD